MKDGYNETMQKMAFGFSIVFCVGLFISAFALLVYKLFTIPEFWLKFMQIALMIIWGVVAIMGCFIVFYISYLVGDKIITKAEER